MPDDSSLDITGIGKIAKAIPAKAWTQVVDTACMTFRQVVAPITALGSGVGRLIDAKFDRLVDAEKVLVAETFSKAHEKVQLEKQKSLVPPNPRVLIGVIEGSSNETDLLLRELWANLLAKEIALGSVHPEFPSVLARLSAQDAQTLAQIAQNSLSSDATLKATVSKILLSITVLGVVVAFKQQAKSFNHEHLQSLGLIVQDNGVWSLTLTGKEFLKVVGGEIGPRVS
jgi:hypothetical protein